jgi:hypothetical protein
MERSPWTKVRNSMSRRMAALLLVVEELGLHNEPDDSCRGACLEDGLHEIVGDCPVDP